MSDRERAGLRGPVRTCLEENTLPDGRKYSNVSEYSPDGSLLTTRVHNQDGSEWLTSRTYDTDGRLAKVVSGMLGDPDLETIYVYNDAGKLSAITNNGGQGGRTGFQYDEQGYKTSIQTFDPKVLERVQNSAFGGSPWDAAVEAGIGVPHAGSVTTTYDQNDQPTELQIRDPAGRLVSRLVRKYDEHGHLSEEKPFLENPALLFLDKLSAEDRAKLTPAQINALSSGMRTLLGGQAPAGTSFSYDSQGRLFETRERNMVFEKTTTILYNDRGDKAEERTSFIPNSVIPIGVPHSIDEHGALAPSEPAKPQTSPLPEQSEVHYEYQYDSHGNWTQQIANEVSNYGPSSRARNRKLTYY